MNLGQEANSQNCAVLDLVYHKSVFHKPVYHNPVYHKPVYHNPVYHKSVYHNAVYHKPVYNIQSTIEGRYRGQKAEAMRSLVQ